MLAGVVLAGGKSSRMGVDKSALQWPLSKMSLLEHCQTQLAQVCAEQVFVSGANHPKGIPDITPNGGPLAGIHATLVALQRQYPKLNELLVVPVDMPKINSEDLQYLVTMGREKKAPSCFEHCFLPLYLPISTQVIDYLSALFTPHLEVRARASKPAQYAIKTMLVALQGAQIPPLKTTQLDNINTPEQWQQHCAEPPLSQV